MFDKYIDYDSVVRKMIERREDNIAALQSLTDQYAELMVDDGVTAIQYDAVAVQTSPTADGMINKAIQREAVKNRLEELEKEQLIFDRAWDRLTDDERYILDTFYMQGLKPGDAVDLLCQGCEREKSTVYRKKDAALSRFKRLLFG